MVNSLGLARASGSLGFSCRGDLSGSGRVVICQAGIPFLKERPERAVEGASSRLQQKVRTALRPLHLLALGEVLTDDGVHRRFRQARRDTLAGPEALAVVDQASRVRPDIDGEFVDRLANLCRFG